MQVMRIIKTTASQWSLQHALRPMLCAAGVGDNAGQSQGKHDAGLYCQTQGQAITRGRVAIRQPDADETPLSPTEKLIAMRMGIFK